MESGTQKTRKGSAVTSPVWEAFWRSFGQKSDFRDKNFNKDVHDIDKFYCPELSLLKDSWKLKNSYNNNLLIGSCTMIPMKTIFVF